MKEARINKLRGGLDCGTVCFGLKGKCHKMCEGIKGAMTNSTSYPCTVAVSLKKLLVPTADATAAELADASQAAMQKQVDDLTARIGAKKGKSE